MSDHDPLLRIVEEKYRSPQDGYREVSELARRQKEKRRHEQPEELQEMANSMSLESLEEMADALSAPDQLRLIAHVSERLARSCAAPEQPGYRERMLSALAECDRVAESIHGEFDSAADLDLIRNERAMR